MTILFCEGYKSNSESDNFFIRKNTCKVCLKKKPMAKSVKNFSVGKVTTKKCEYEVNVLPVSKPKKIEINRKKYL